jgi:hypothetical protein
MSSNLAIPEEKKRPIASRSGWQFRKIGKFESGLPLCCQCALRPHSIRSRKCRDHIDLQGISLSFSLYRIWYARTSCASRGWLDRKVHRESLVPSRAFSPATAH